MSTKDFKKGMETTAKTFEEKFKRQEEAVDRVGQKLNQKIDEIGQVTNVLIDDLTSIQKKELYDINTIIDIADLDETEKEYLLAVLYQLANDLEKPSENQQYYIRSVKFYLDIVEPQTEVNLTLVENFDNLNTQKAILQVVMEFLFLGSEQHEYTKQQEEFLEYFNLNNKTRVAIKNCINNIYKATGARGLSEKYGYVADEENISSKLHISKENLNQIKKIIDSWKECSCIYSPTIMLEPDMCDMSYYEEDIHSMSECKKKAEGLLKQAYDNANSYLSSYSSKSLSKYFTEEFCEHIENDFTNIRHHLRILNQISEIVDEINYIEEYLNLEDLRRKIKEELDKELEENSYFYKMENFSYFSNKIEYNKWDDFEDDEGVGIKLIFKIVDFATSIVYYDFDATTPWCEIDNDLTKRADSFTNSAKTIIERIMLKKYIEPIMQILDEINFKFAK